MKNVISVGEYYSDDFKEHLWCLYLDGKLFYRSPRLERCLRALRLLNLGPQGRYEALWQFSVKLANDMGDVEPQLVFAVLVKVEDLPCMRS